MDGWARQAIWWHVYPLGFLGAEREALPPGAAPVPRLRGLEPWLDYLIELGCNGLLLGPVFAAETHGYDTVDHYRVDSRLGSNDDLVWLLDACRTRGIRVLLDGVFHHVGRGFPAFADVTALGRESAYADWFRLHWEADGFRYDTFEGHERLVALNHASPAVVGYVADVMTHWLDAGIDGWRLDAAYAVPPAFWAQVTRQVRTDHPDAWLVGEAIHGDYARLVGDGGLDSVTQYELWKAIWSSLNDRNFYELAWALDRHNGFVERFLPLTFLGNHDVTRIASRLTDERHLGHALVLLFTLPGAPSVYSGDEQAFHGVKEDRVGGDDAVRPPFPATPAQLAPYGRAVHDLHQELIGLRRRHPWLACARVTVTRLSNEQLAYTVAGEGHSLDVALNLAETTADGVPAHAWHVEA